MSTYTTLLDLLKKDPVTEGSDVFNIATMLNDNWDKIDAFIALVTASLATVYSTSSAYAVGAYCTHGGQLYRCKTAIGSGGEAWTASHWQAISAPQLVQDKASSTTPAMDGTAAVGTGTTWARADHVHPVDTSRAASSHNHAASAINSGTLGVARGGTGKSSVTANSFLVGNGTSALAEKTVAQVITMLNSAQFALGSYIGTGTYGSSNSMSVAFSFVPKFIFFYRRTLDASSGTSTPYMPERSYDGYNIAFPTSDLTTSYVSSKGPMNASTSNFTKSFAKKSSDGKTIYWYSTYSSGGQLNDNNTKYDYLAIG